MYSGPRKISHNKIRKGNLKKLCFKSSILRFGTIGIKAAESGFIDSKQLEAARQILTRSIRKTGKIWLRIYPSIPITQKSKGSRMGKGVGQISHWSSKVSCGTVLFEICGANADHAHSALKLCSFKLPIKTKIFT